MSLMAAAVLIIFGDVSPSSAKKPV